MIYEMPLATSPDSYIIRYAVACGINECGLPRFLVPLRTIHDSQPNVAEIDRERGTITRYKMPGPGEGNSAGGSE